MAAPLPPPQREPNERELALIAAIREYLQEPVEGAEAWLNKINGLRNLTVDADDAWETALVEAKAAGVSWNELEAGTGMVRSSLQWRLDHRPSQEMAARPRERRWSDAEVAERRRSRKVPAARRNAA